MSVSNAKSLNPISGALFANAYGKGITVYEPIGGMCAGLEACLHNGFRIDRYFCSEPDANAARVVSARLERLSFEYGTLLCLHPDLTGVSGLTFRSILQLLTNGPCSRQGHVMARNGSCLPAGAGTMWAGRKDHLLLTPA
jgi:hypothetical protein